MGGTCTMGAPVDQPWKHALGILNGFMEPTDYVEVIEHPNHYNWEPWNSKDKLTKNSFSPNFISM